MKDAAASSSNEEQISTSNVLKPEASDRRDGNGSPRKGNTIWANWEPGASEESSASTSGNQASMGSVPNMEALAGSDANQHRELVELGKFKPPRKAGGPVATVKNQAQTRGQHSNSASKRSSKKTAKKRQPVKKPSRVSCGGPEVDSNQQPQTAATENNKRRGPQKELIKRLLAMVKQLSSTRPKLPPLSELIKFISIKKKLEVRFGPKTAAANRLKSKYKNLVEMMERALFEMMKNARSKCKHSGCYSSTRSSEVPPADLVRIIKRSRNRGRNEHPPNYSNTVGISSSRHVSGSSGRGSDCSPFGIDEASEGNRRAGHQPNNRVHSTDSGCSSGSSSVGYSNSTPSAPQEHHHCHSITNGGPSSMMPANPNLSFNFPIAPLVIQPLALPEGRQQTVQPDSSTDASATINVMNSSSRRLNKGASTQKYSIVMKNKRQPSDQAQFAAAEQAAADKARTESDGVWSVDDATLNLLMNMTSEEFDGQIDPQFFDDAPGNSLTSHSLPAGASPSTHHDTSASNLDNWPNENGGSANGSP